MDFTKPILLIDKPKGISSFDVIRRLRRRYTQTHDGAKAPKMGHAGTLDPLASGLMLIGCGQGTKLLTNLTKLDKEYVATIRLGEQRSTGDLAGEVVDECVVNEAAEILVNKISAALAAMRGELVLTVSAYSAIKVDGVPMYKRARKAELSGDTILDIPVRKMVVHEVELLDVVVEGGRAEVQVRFYVASGTYIRSLAEELGRRIGYPACLSDLRRTQVGEYHIDDSLPV